PSVRSGARRQLGPSSARFDAPAWGLPGSRLARRWCTSSENNRPMIRFRSLFAVTLASLLVLIATPAVAQVCLGIPLSARQTAVGLTAAFPENANAFGIDGRHKLTDQLVLGAGYTLGTVDEDDFGGED